MLELLYSQAPLEVELTLKRLRECLGKNWKSI